MAALEREILMERILILDDLPAARAWLKEAVATAFPGADCIEAATLREARTRLEEGRFGLFLVDLELPDGSGIELIHEARRLLGDMTVVVSTIHDEGEYLFPALKAGAQGYILKEHSQEEIAHMLDKAVAGEPPVSPAVARRLIGFFNDDACRADEPVGLTPRETDVLKIVAKGYTLAEAAQLLGVTKNTAAGYLKSCYSKLQISSRAEATSEALRLGIIK